jgi:peptidoglycan/LPS O-acetylase OafA/YrhL
MRTVERPWLWLLPVGIAAGAAAFAVVLTSDHAGDQVSFEVVAMLLGWSFIGSGLFAWARRPDNRTGALMLAVGFAWFLGSLSYTNSSVLYTLGSALGALALAVFIHLLFAFPSGRVEGTRERAIVAAAAPEPGRAAA